MLKPCLEDSTDNKRFLLIGHSKGIPHILTNQDHAFQCCPREMLPFGASLNWHFKIKCLITLKCN